MSLANLEYLLFNTVVLASVLLAMHFLPSPFQRRWRWGLVSSVVVALPYLAWDAVVADRHWSFNPTFTTTISWLGLPLGEWLFFITVAFACLFTWEVVWRPTRAPSRVGPGVYVGLFWFGLVAIAAALMGFEYTALACASVPVSAMIDYRLGTHLFRQRAFYGQLACVFVFVFIFDGYLAGRPVVLYHDPYYLGIRVGYVPIEDFAYATGWLATVHAVYVAGTRTPLSIDEMHDLERRRRRILAGPIRRRLSDYRQRFTAEQAADHVFELCQLPLAPMPAVPGERPRIAVIGSGLAGLQAAAVLIKGDVDVDVYERDAYFGGKVGGWETTLSTGERQSVEHGFHAFFGQYYNLLDLLAESGVTRKLKSMPDYMILTVDGRRLSYRPIARTPLYNLFSLLLHGHYRLRDVLFRPALWGLVELLRYDLRRTAHRFDGVSYAQWANQLKLPDDLRLTFNSFSRAFFAPPERMSTAELIKSFHFFFLSHDHGLLYDFIVGDYAAALVDPIVARLRDAGVTLHASAEVQRLEANEGGFVVHSPVGPQHYHGVVLAADVPAARLLLESKDPVLPEKRQWQRQVASLEVTSSYAVWRIWIDRPVRRLDLVAFVITERRQVLDSITFYERVHEQAQRWAATHHGSVLELHCYCVPDDVDSEARLCAALLEDLHHFLPELRGANIVGQHLQWRADFPAFHVGKFDARPCTRTPVPGLVLAGDWVKLPYPAMLMEAACTSGRLAANELLLAMGKRGVSIDTVARTGLLARPRQ